MNILVCIKQVPELEQVRLVDGPGGEAEVTEPAEYRLNRFDAHAVEAAVRLKEARGDVCVDALTVGPERSLEVVKRAIGMGADEGLHILTPADLEAEPATVAAWIAQYARRRKYDLIFTGNLSEDGMNGQVGAMTAALLHLPCTTQVIRLQLDNDPFAALVEREIEGGQREILQVALPAVLTIQSGINRPRYPSLSNLLRAARQGVETIPAASFENPGTTIQRLGCLPPRRRRSGTILQGTAQEKAERFLTVLKQRAVI